MLIESVRQVQEDARTFPGLRRLRGSIACLIVCISSTVPSPSSSIRYSFLPTPTPCSPVPVSMFRSVEIKKAVCKMTNKFHLG